VEFWIKFMHTVDSQCHREGKAEDASLTSFQGLMTSYEIKKHIRKIYTHTKFHVFQRQLYVGRVYCHI